MLKMTSKDLAIKTVGYGGVVGVGLTTTHALAKIKDEERRGRLAKIAMGTGAATMFVSGAIAVSSRNWSVRRSNLSVELTSAVGVGLLIGGALSFWAPKTNPLPKAG